MSSLFDGALYDAAASTFEQLAYMNVIVPAKRHRRKDAEISVQVSFSGTYNGTLYISLFGRVLPMLAANMLGENEPPAEGMQCDALGEFANVVCGNLLPKIAGSKAVFDVGVPLLISNLSTYLFFDPAAEVRVGLDGGGAELRLILADAMENLCS
jgi:CheY-specific phosphatase CheX